MSLNPILSDLNIKKSLIKYFTDTLITADSVMVRFDGEWLKPVSDETAWVGVNFEKLIQLWSNNGVFTITPCTRYDPDGISLSRLCDVVLGRLIDETAYDARRLIPIYDTSQVVWEKINYLKILECNPSAEFSPPDGTRYKIFNVLFWIITI